MERVHYSKYELRRKSPYAFRVKGKHGEMFENCYHHHNINVKNQIGMHMAAPVWSHFTYIHTCELYIIRIPCI